MKRLSMAALLIIALSTGAVAHEGSIGLYADIEATDCDRDFIPYVATTIEVVYFRSDSGPDGIFSVQFKLETPAEGWGAVQTFEGSPAVSLVMGEITTGISCSFPNCTGAGSDYVHIGTITVLPFLNTPMTFRILAADDINPEDPPIAPRVAICDEERTIVGVLGGWFTTPEGSCNIGTEETTWGAIKEMYKD